MLPPAAKSSGPAKGFVPILKELQEKCEAMVGLPPSFQQLGSSLHWLPLFAPELTPGIRDSIGSRDISPLTVDV
jgi:hypothetical protein